MFEENIENLMNEARNPWKTPQCHMPAMRIMFISLSLGASQGMKGIKKVNHPTLEQVSHEFANICRFFEIDYIIAPIRFIPLHRATFDTFVEKLQKKNSSTGL